MTPKNDFRRTVLVVDDEPVNREMLGEILKTDYEVLYAENGTEALGILRSHKERISLVLLDLLMPEIDGYEVLQSVKDDDVLSKIPVIVLTSEKGAEVKSLQLGAVDFLKKPYDMPEVILARVRRSIALAEGARIIQSTEKDALTGLYTRDYFFEYAHQLNARKSDEERAPMDAIVLNLTNFHMVNELYGRATGDKILKTVASSIQELIQESGGIACRYDADGFYLYTAQHWNYDKPLSRIAYHLSQFLKESEIQIRMGVCQETFLSTSIEQRFDRAMQACNSLRGVYGSAFVIYDKQMYDQEVFEARIIADFAEAVKTKQFKVCYQPKYNIKGQKPVLSSMEALVRWEHPELGNISPSKFIPQFEKNGLIQQLDRYVWQEAAMQMAKWKKEYGKIIPVSVNVSRVDLFDPKIIDFLTSVVEKNHKEKDKFLLEITESAYIDNSDQIVQIVSQIRNAGFKVEMDDFGSGYSSLNMLVAMPIDVLKLDIGFIRNITTDKKAYYMVRVVMQIAKNLGIQVVAEGVETKEQYELLKSAGCDIIQGFYFSKPISAEAMSKLMASA